MVTLLQEKDKERFINYPNGFFENIKKNRYKDTNYSIVKRNKNSWVVYIIDDSDKNNCKVYSTNAYHSFTSAKIAIETKILYNECKQQQISYNNIIELIEK